MRAVYGFLVLLPLLGACDDGGPSDAKTNVDAKTEAKTDAVPEAEADEPRGAFATYQAKSMASEAKINLSMISTGVRSAFAEERPSADGLTMTTGHLPPTTTMTPEAGVCCKQPKGECPVDMGDWSQEGWTQLDFTPRAPHRYSYQIVTEGQEVTVRAQGDLDCDGKLSTYDLVGTVSGDDLIFSPDAIETDPLE